MSVKGWVQICRRWRVGEFWQVAKIFGDFGSHPLIKAPELGGMQDNSLQLVQFLPLSDEAQFLASDQIGFALSL